MNIIAINGSPRKDGRISKIVEEIIEGAKENGLITWDSVTLVQDEKNFRLFIDHDKMELFSENKQNALHKEIENVGYKILETRPLRRSKSAPPWSIEILETIKKVK